MTRRVWVVSELYHPEETSTGHIMTAIAEHVAKHADVRVLCGQPSYSRRGVRASGKESRNGVAIHRCSSTTFAKDSVLGRSINAITLTLTMSLNALTRFRRGDKVLVVTNPPTLPFVVLLACRLRCARCYLLVHDIHPESMIAAGMIRGGSVVAKMAARASRLLFRTADEIIAIGRDMSEVIARKAGRDNGPIHVIPNWSDSDVLQPENRATNELLNELGWNEMFVVQYSGNMGRPNAVEAVVDTATRLQDHPAVRFLFVGTGAKRAWLEKTVRERGLHNVAVRSPLPRHEQSKVLNACDICVVPLVRGMFGLGVPSRSYNSLAVGKPIIAVGHPRSELARLVIEGGVGWVVPENETERLDDVILDAYTNTDLRVAMGERARELAAGALRREIVLSQYSDLLAG